MYNPYYKTYFIKIIEIFIQNTIFHSYIHN